MVTFINVSIILRINLRIRATASLSVTGAPVGITDIGAAVGKIGVDTGAGAGASVGVIIGAFVGAGIKNVVGASTCVGNNSVFVHVNKVSVSNAL
jgi:hypothetical protein